MSDNDEWGPWIEHDGRGCPLQRGTLGEAELRTGRIVAFRASCGSTRGGPYVPAPDNAYTSAWVWGGKPDRWKDEEVIRYRIRKPRGAVILESLLADLPKKVDA